MTSIEILYFASCPGWQATVERVREVVSELGLTASVSIVTVAVETAADAERFEFVGSPTVRIAGKDIDAAGAAGASIGLQCRLYPSHGQLERVPSAGLIRAALQAPSDARRQT